MERPLRVAHITHYTELYGANRSLLDLLHGLREAGGVRSHVIMPHAGALSAALDALDVPWAVVPFAPWLSEPHASGRWYHRLRQRWQQRRAALERMRANATALPSLDARLEAWEVDLVHANSAAVGVVPALVEAGRWPLVWHLRELPEAHYGMVFDGGARRFARALDRAQALIAISDVVAADVRRRVPSVRRLQRIYNGLFSATELDALRSLPPERSTPQDPFTFLVVGLIHPAKGQVEAVEALALLHATGRRARLHIVGGGRSEALRACITEHGLDAWVELHGFVPDVGPLYRGADAYLACSRHEALGRATIEALAHGLPVIALRSGAHPEVLQATEGAPEEAACGLLYDGGADALARRMAQVMDDGTLRQTLSERALASLPDRFGRAACTAAVKDLFRAVAAQHPARP